MDKVDKIIELLPKIYRTTWEKDGLFYYFLEMIAKKLEEVDLDLFRLMKSHWIGYAEGNDLDRLGAMYNLPRRRITAKTWENDASYRTRIKNFLPQFIGGGTPKAIITASIEALGLPQQLPQDMPQKMKDEILRLYPKLYEFSPSFNKEDASFEKIPDGNYHATLTITNESVLLEKPTITIEAINTQVNILQVVRDNSESFIITESVPIGKRLIISPEGIASIDGKVVSTNIKVILLPKGESKWTFTIPTKNRFNEARFDEATFYFPELQAKVTLEWTERSPLTFEVAIPWNLEEIISQIRDEYRNEYNKLIMSHQPMPRDEIALLIRDIKAAGVEGYVRYYLTSLETQTVVDELKFDAEDCFKETHSVKEELFIGTINSFEEEHLMKEVFFISGVFNATGFDGSVFG